MAENNYQRDERIRHEEARLVRMEEALSRIEKNQVQESGTFAAHMKDDDQRFQSIDSRLIGVQTQLTGIHDTLKAIDQRDKNLLESHDGFEKRLGVVEKFQSAQTNTVNVLISQWKIISGGVLFGVTVATFIFMVM